MAAGAFDHRLRFTSAHIFVSVAANEAAPESGVVARPVQTTALLTAAALSILASPSTLHVNTDAPSGPRRRHGHTLHDGRTFLGHLTPKLCPGEAEQRPGLLAHLHTLRTLAATPEALSLLVEALDPEILPILGRALMRRVR